MANELDKLRLNLGCGVDLRYGYVNVDFHDVRGDVLSVDLTQFPWPWPDNSVDEILMLDLLEHFHYRLTDSILLEVYRILKPGGFVDIQVPDFEHCALAALGMHQYLCNVCGNAGNNYEVTDNGRVCSQCKTPMHKIAEAAIKRLYGGQDHDGNFHYTAFTKDLLSRKLMTVGFKDEGMEFLEKHHQWKNWNFKIRAVKTDDDTW